MALFMGKNSLKLVGKLKKKPYVSINKKSSKLDKKTR